jgi:hypothetical protein
MLILPSKGVDKPRGSCYTRSKGKKEGTYTMTHTRIVLGPGVPRERDASLRATEYQFEDVNGNTATVLIPDKFVRTLMAEQAARRAHRERAEREDALRQLQGVF